MKNKETFWYLTFLLILPYVLTLGSILLVWCILSFLNWEFYDFGIDITYFRIRLFIGLNLLLSLILFNSK